MACTHPPEMNFSKFVIALTLASWFCIKATVEVALNRVFAISGAADLTKKMCEMQAKHDEEMAALLLQFQDTHAELADNKESISDLRWSVLILTFALAIQTALIVSDLPSRLC